MLTGLAEFTGRRFWRWVIHPSLDLPPLHSPRRCHSAVLKVNLALGGEVRASTPTEFPILYFCYCWCCSAVLLLLVPMVMSWTVSRPSSDTPSKRSREIGDLLDDYEWDFFFASIAIHDLTLLRKWSVALTRRQIDGQGDGQTRILIETNNGEIRDHPFMTSTQRGRGSGSGGRMWTGGWVHTEN